MPPRKKGPPAPLPEGWTLTDNQKKSWRLGPIIGQGGFGLIYLASQCLDASVSPDSDFVIKVELAENGPLFTELKFYQRAAKPESCEYERLASQSEGTAPGAPGYSATQAHIRTHRSVSSAATEALASVLSAGGALGAQGFSYHLLHLPAWWSHAQKMKQGLVSGPAMVEWPPPLSQNC